MKCFGISEARKELGKLEDRKNISLGSFGENAIGIGRFVTGSSPLEKHNNGDELLLVTDGTVHIEVLDRDGTSCKETINQGQLLSVPKGQWHQLSAEDCVTIMYISPPDEGAERQREHPFKGGT